LSLSVVRQFPYFIFQTKRKSKNITTKVLWVHFTMLNELGSDDLLGSNSSPQQQNMFFAFFTLESHSTAKNKDQTINLCSVDNIVVELAPKQSSTLSSTGQ
jgi:hypothetical protein